MSDEPQSMQTRIVNIIPDDDQLMQTSWVQVSEPPSRGSSSGITACSIDTSDLSDLRALGTLSTANSVQKAEGASPPKSPAAGGGSPSDALSYEKICTGLKDAATDTSIYEKVLAWSSRPEERRRWEQMQLGEHSTTPPNSPMPESAETPVINLRHSKWMNSPFLSAEFFMIQLAYTFAVLGIGFGIGCFYMRRGESPLQR